MDDKEATKPSPASPTPPHDAGAPRGRRRGKRPGRGPHRAPESAPPLAGDLLAHVRAAVERLRAVSLAAAKARGAESCLEGIELRLALGGRESSRDLAQRFVRDLLERLGVAQLETDAVVAHRAYCFRCESFACAHSKPKDPRSVLAGYEPTGRPIWADFVDRLFNLRDPRAERLGDASAGVVALVEEGAALTANRIEAFGGAAPPIELLSQTAAGLFPIRDGSAIDEESAITAQVLRVRRGARSRLVLHAIGDPRLLDATGSAADPDLSRILAAARASLAAGERRSEVDADAREFARAVARELARDLEHHYRVRRRRTHHAIARAETGRPTSHAFPEARAAADDAIRVDVETGSIVLLGGNARVHFFNAEGRHVSSVRFRGETIRARVDTGRWRAATPEEIRGFRASVPSDEAR